ncbi:hypothetical protein BP6252_01475 [Coleophoma cylindrospora]|uniref:Beta-glucuronidase C-terminal domain-containing protein n=1 Tax=Coleophoma cylindrospora TaxID=1849047 RepID=A0A3D8SSY7_9HELO|nr:hypothetical protein BP6252_01475 [Coleophoma cylindrospora]
MFPVFALALGFELVVAVEGIIVNVSRSLPAGIAKSPFEAFVSYSIEYAFFPDFAGNESSPNTFSDNLLNNLGNLTGTKPYIRVGGNTQDYALYNASLTVATDGIINPARSVDYPTTLYTGPSFFESYKTWPGVKFVHGFNLGLGGNSSAGWDTLLETVPLACKALGKERLLWWEYGNEPDLYSTSAQGPVRPSTWNEVEYVTQWLNGTRHIKEQLFQACPELLGNDTYGYLAPSFAGTNNHLKPIQTWEDGVDVDQDIKLFSSHNYIGGATSPGVTLQGTLMNHTSTVHSISAQVAVAANLSSLATVPFILGETNSLYNEGAPGLSNAFGAALWGVDFNLWCASVGISRVHMHQGTDYRYAAWQPIETNKTTKGTKAPYYGSIAVAAFLGDLTDRKKALRIANIPLQTPFEAAYAAYEHGDLARVAVINMREYNYTVNGTSSVTNPVARPSQTYSFYVGELRAGKVAVKRLYANGSDAISGITWDGWSYNWELDQGRPVRLSNVTVGEEAFADKGVVGIVVEDSSAAVLEIRRT